MKRERNNYVTLLWVFLVLLASSCKLEISNIFAPDNIETNGVFTLQIQGKGISADDNTTDYGIVIQLPESWEVLRADAVLHNLPLVGQEKYVLYEDTAIESLFTPESGYKVWAGTATRGGSSGYPVSCNLKIVVGDMQGALGQVFECSIKAVAGAVRNGEWHSDDPEGIFDFSLIAETSRYAHAFTVTVVEQPVMLDFYAHPSEGNAPLPVLFNASAYDPDGDDIKYFWDFDADQLTDEVTASGEAYHVYNEAGQYAAFVSVARDASGSSMVTSEIVLIEVKQPNNRVIIDDFTGDPDMGPAPHVVNFRCSAYDPDGDALSYLWDFDGDFVPEETSTSGETVHVYFEPGIYEAYVIVSEDASPSGTIANDVVIPTDASPSGLSIAGPVTIRVTTAPPVIEAFSADPADGYSPLTVNFQCSAYDPDGDTLSYLWDFNGDGEIDTVTEDGNAQEVYEIPGRYDAYVVVADDASPSAYQVSEFIAINIFLNGDGDKDHDVDGLDLLLFIQGQLNIDLAQFAAQFGK